MMLPEVTLRGTAITGGTRIAKTTAPAGDQAWQEPILPADQAA